MAITAAQAAAEVSATLTAIQTLRGGAAAYRMPDGRMVTHHNLSELDTHLATWMKIESRLTTRRRAAVGVFREPA